MNRPTRIQRASRHERFYVVSHKLIDADFSAEALGVSLYVLSRPDDWVVHQNQLQKRFKCGRDKMARILNEIVACGFAKKTQERNQSGEFDGWLWTFSEEPFTDKPFTDKPATDNPHLLNTDIKTNTDKTYSFVQIGKCVNLTAIFSFFWEAYPRKQSREDTTKAFLSANIDHDTLKIILQNIHDRISSGEWSTQRKSYIPLPATYLRGKRWEDEVIYKTLEASNDASKQRGSNSRADYAANLHNYAQATDF